MGLQTQLRDLTNRVLPFSMAGGGAGERVGACLRRPLRDAVASGVAVAVAAVPEGSAAGRDPRPAGVGAPVDQAGRSGPQSPFGGGARAAWMWCASTRPER